MGVGVQRKGWIGAVAGFDRNAYLLFITGGLLGFTYWGITYLLTNLFVLRLGYGTEVVGNLNALFYILHMAFSLPAGALGMRLGSRRAMFLGGALALFGWALAPAASFVLFPHMRMTALVASRVISSLGGALFIVNSNPALIGAVEPGANTYAFAFNGAVISLMTFLGSLCGGILPGLFAAITHTSMASPVPYGMALWAAVVLLAPGLVSIGLFRETGKGSRSAAANGAEALPLGIISVIAVVRFLRECGYGGVLTFFNVYLDRALHLPTPSIGIMVSVSSIASIVSTPLMPLIARRWGTGRTSLVGLVTMAVAVLPIAVSGAWQPAALGWAGMTAANSINEASMQVYILGIVAPRWRAVMSGAANMATTLGLAASASGGGYLIRSLGYRGVFLIAAAALFASAAVFATHLGAKRGRDFQSAGVPAQ